MTLGLSIGIILGSRWVGVWGKSITPLTYDIFVTCG